MRDPQYIGMERAGRPQVVLLPRDPEVAYIYWEWPGAQANGGRSARLSLSIEDEQGASREVESFEVAEATGGRFMSFDRPGASHSAVLTWSDEVQRSEVVLAPRREAGEDSAAFVQVTRSGDGLTVEPTEHEHFTHGRFPAAAVINAGSHSIFKRSE